ncbi:MAG: SGNH/GDSL hydrolase family protein [Alphaproteobacteria bacterium]|nr:SGNH/GDSL hydrolase family protein [Alphaproteobacteria bacterium]MCB9931738.1 SGNH/GDSL hydrolase family protein [Alphaproteobacteria bacterium]
MNLTLRQKEILTGLVIAALAFGWVLAGEAALFLQQWRQFGGQADVEKSDSFYIDPETGLRIPRPNAALGKLQFNSLGFRGDELEMPKPPGRIRLAFVGSSSTLDPNVTDDRKTWAAQAMKVVRDRLPNCDFDYLNAGVPGFGLAETTTYFQHNVAKTEPDLVVIWAGGFNEKLNDYAAAAHLTNGTHYSPSLLAEISRFWAKLEKNAVVIRRQRAAHSNVGKLDVSRFDLITDYKAELAQMRLAVTGTGALPVIMSIPGWLREGLDLRLYDEAAKTDVFFMPYMSYDALIDTRQRFDAALTEFGQAQHTPIIQWWGLMQPKPSYFADSNHFSPQGSVAYGAAIGDRLADVIESKRVKFAAACDQSDK